MESASPTDTSTTISNIALGAAIGVLVTLVAVVLITVVCIALLYTYQKSHQLEDSSTKNESYSLRQLDDPVCNEASSTQPNYSSLGPDMEATSALGTNGYESIKYGTSGYDHTKHITMPRTKLGNPTPKTQNDAEELDDPVYDETSSTQPNYSSENPDGKAIKFNYQVTNGYDYIDDFTKPQPKWANPTQRTDPIKNNAEQHTVEVVNANKMEEAQKISDERNQQKANVQTTSANLTRVRDEANEKRDDFYDTEEHIYSEVNKPKKESEENPSEDSEGEGEEDYH